MKLKRRSGLSPHPNAGLKQEERGPRMASLCFLGSMQWDLGAGGVESSITPTLMG